MKKKYKFIDLFAGIGGFHIAFHNIGAKCVFSSEWDEHARETYYKNHKEISPEIFPDFFAGDITKVSPKSIPNFDILCGGFPCQPFSQAGHKKGFTETRGTLFFDIANIIKEKQPKAFLLENVRGLLKHDDGETLKTIERVLKELGYSFYHKTIKASDFGLPQHRPRLYMVGFKESKIDFNFPEPFPLKMNMSDIWGGECSREIGFTLRVGGRGSSITDRRNWDSYLVDGEVKRLSSNEGIKMQGLPKNFVFPVSETQAMKQLGNSVAIPVIEAIGKEIINSLKGYYES